MLSINMRPLIEKYVCVSNRTVKGERGEAQMSWLRRGTETSVGETMSCLALDCPGLAKAPLDRAVHAVHSVTYIQLPNRRKMYSVVASAILARKQPLIKR